MGGLLDTEQSSMALISVMHVIAVWSDGQMLIAERCSIRYTCGTQQLQLFTASGCVIAAMNRTTTTLMLADQIECAVTTSETNGIVLSHPSTSTSPSATRPCWSDKDNSSQHTPLAHHPRGPRRASHILHGDVWRL